MRRRAWFCYLLTGALVVGGYPFVPAGWGKDGVYAAVGSSCMVAMLWGARLHRPNRPWAWYAMAIGQFLWVVGDGILSWYHNVRHDQPFPSIADACYLAGYPALAVGLWLLIRGRRPDRDLPGMLDSATLTAGLGTLSWVVLARPTIEASRELPFAAAVGVAYPLIDIVLAAGLIRLVTTPGGRTIALRLLTAAVALLLAADSLSDALNLFTSMSATYLDLLWLASYVLWGAAALHPSMVTLSVPPPEAAPVFSRRRLFALVAATFVAPAILAAESLSGRRVDVWPVVIGSVLLFSLVVWRMSVAIRDIVVAQRQRDALQDDLVYQAAHDALTGLPNRAQGLTQIAGALNRARRSGSMTALLFIDLDGFKAINDRLGHAAGDHVLCVAAGRMQAAVRGGDMVARLGGDEFIVLLEPIQDEIDAIEVADRIIADLSAPIEFKHDPAVTVGASVGVAFSRHAGTDPEDLLQAADAAVYQAKSNGRGRVEVFGNALRQELRARATLDTELRAAVANDELVLHYQPIVEVESGALYGFEALLRWRHPDGRLLNPSDFIPAAEQSDLICEVDTWVLEHAVRQLDEWARRYPSRLITMAINVSGRHIGRPRLIEDVTQVLQRYSVDPARIVLEITESTVIDELLGVYHLDIIRQLGVRVAIDDFGSGYNSLTRLRQMQVDVVKIDRAFLDDDDPTGRTIVRLLVETAAALGLPVVAEGVESPEQLDMLRELRCAYGQGFAIARPADAAVATELVAQGGVLTVAPGARRS